MAEASRPPVYTTPVVEQNRTMTRDWYRAIANLFRWILNAQQLGEITTTDIPASAVSVTSPNAATQTAAYVQADVQSIATLANELKTDLTALVAEVNTISTLVNELKARVNDINSALNT